MSEELETRSRNFLLFLKYFSSFWKYSLFFFFFFSDSIVSRQYFDRVLLYFCSIISIAGGLKCSKKLAFVFSILFLSLFFLFLYAKYNFWILETFSSSASTILLFRNSEFFNRRPRNKKRSNFVEKSGVETYFLRLSTIKTTIIC